MIEFIAGVCVGYFCRPVVAIAIDFVTDMWKKIQDKYNSEDKTDTKQ